MTSLLESFGFERKDAPRLVLGVTGAGVLGGGLIGVADDRPAAVVITCIATGTFLLLAAVFGAKEVSLGAAGGIKLGAEDDEPRDPTPES